MWVVEVWNPLGRHKLLGVELLLYVYPGMAVVRF